MRPFTFLLVILAATAPPPAATAPASSDAYHIVVAHRAVSAGEHVVLKVEPPPPPGVRLGWTLAMSAPEIGPAAAIYRAPFVIPPGTPPVEVSVSISGPSLQTGATAAIELAPDSLPGAADCLGPDQTFSRVTGEIIPSYRFVDTLPEAIHTVVPEYPRGELARGGDATIPVMALVCRDGQVLDVYSPPSFASPGDDLPIPRDPKLVEAALAAVRAWRFKPAMAGGQAVAVWVDVPVRFRR